LVRGKGLNEGGKGRRALEKRRENPWAGDKKKLKRAAKPKEEDDFSWFKKERRL